MISIPSIDKVTFSSLATIKGTIAELLDYWQQWSDETFGGKYRDAAETLISGLLLLICCTAIRLYDGSKRCLGEAFGYWLAEAKQQFVAVSGLWIEKGCKLLPAIIYTCDRAWDDLKALTAINSEVLSYELEWAIAAQE